VGLDDRTADRKAHSHAIGFRGEERIEYPLHVPSTDSRACVGDRNHHTAIIPNIGTHGKNAKAIHGGHRLDRIGDQIEEHLLQLNSISHYLQRPCAWLNFDRDPVTFQIVVEQCNSFFDEAVDLERSSDAGIVPEARPDAVDHRSRTMPIISDLPEPRFCLVEIGSGAIEPA
jgi:hypothetical protein